MVVAPKQELHELVDRLSDNDLVETLAYVRWLVTNQGSPELEALPIDDEPETDEERIAVARALRQLQQGDIVPHAQVRHEFGA